MSTEVCAQPACRLPRARQWPTIGSVCLAWLFTSIAPLWRHLSHFAATFVLLVGLLLCGCAMSCFGKKNRQGRTLSAGWLVALFAALMLAFTMLYTRTLHLVGRSDREDALHRALWALHHHIYPYSLKTYLGNPITPLPGALLLAEPFFLLGHIGFQNIFWLAVLFLLCEKYFQHRTTSFLLLSIFLLFSPSSVSDFTSGGDYIVNLIYVIVALACSLKSLRSRLMVQVSAFAFLGIAISSRALYFLVLIPLLIALLQRVSWRRASALYAITLSAFLLITVPIFTPHPASRFIHQLEQQSGKLRSLPPAMHAEYSLPLIAVCVMCLAYFVQIDFAKLLLFVGIGNAVVLVPPVVGLAIARRWPVHELDYVIICVLPFYFWIFHRYDLLTTSSHSLIKSAG